MYAYHTLQVKSVCDLHVEVCCLRMLQYMHMLPRIFNPKSHLRNGLGGTSSQLQVCTSNQGNKYSMSQIQISILLNQAQHSNSP